MLSGRTTTTISQPAHGPMDINAGRPDWRELLPLFGLVLLGLLVAALGATGMIVAWPRDNYEAGAWNWLGLLTGGAFAWGGGSVAWSLRTAIVGGVGDYRLRQREWHQAQLDKFIEGDGKIIAQQVSEWEYNPLDMRSLLLGFAVILTNAPAKLTVDELETNGLWLKIEHRLVKVLTFNQATAMQFLNLLAEARIIEGRGPRQSGRVLVQEPRDQVLRLLKTAARSPDVQAALAAQEGV